jgi:hypothetical protein
MMTVHKSKQFMNVPHLNITRRLKSIVSNQRWPITFVGNSTLSSLEFDFFLNVFCFVRREVLCPLLLQHKRYHIETCVDITQSININGAQFGKVTKK